MTLNQEQIKPAILIGSLTSFISATLLYTFIDMANDLSTAFTDDDYTQSHQPPPLSSSTFLGILAFSASIGIYAGCNYFKRYGIFHHHQRDLVGTDAPDLEDGMQYTAAAAA